MSKLKIVYEGYKNRVNGSFLEVDLSLALVLLLLEDKDSLVKSGISLNDFFKGNEEQIIFKIDKIIQDFSISMDDLRNDLKNFLIVTSGVTSDEAVLKVILHVNSLSDDLVKYESFKNGLMMLSTVSGNSKKTEYSPEKFYNIYCEAFGFPEIEELEKMIIIGGRIDNVQYANFSLEERYYYHKIGYSKTCSHPDVNVLLSIILLMNKDNFGLMDCSNSKEFYEMFEYEINTYIHCVMTEFSITEEELEDFRLGMSLDNSAILLDEDINMAQVDGFEFEKDMMPAITLSPGDKKYSIFKPAIDLLFMALKNPNISNEVLHNCLVNRYKTKKKSDSSSKTTLLGDRYAKYVDEYRKMFKHPHPSELLILLLIDSRSEFSCIEPYSTGYWELIDSKMQKVMLDFDIDRGTILKNIYGDSNKQVSDYDYKIAKLRFFSDSIGALRVVLRDYRDYSDDTCFLKILTIYGSNWRSGINYISKDSKSVGPKKARRRRQQNPVPTGFKW